MVENIIWLGHSSFKLIGEKVVYIDPWKIKNGKADIILVTHDHYDHLSLRDIEKLSREDTTIVVPKSVVNKISGNVKGVKPGDKFKVNGVNVEVVMAYNTNKSFHPKANNWCGYVITLNGKRIYHAGDTDLIEEMNNLRNIDVALLPVSGTYVMTAEEAAEACDRINPKLAIPMHWGSLVGSEQDAIRFKQLAKCEVEILEITE